MLERGGHDFIECGHGVPGADFAGVLRVVFEVFLREHSVFVAQEPIGGHLRGIEFHLDLHVFGHRHEGAGHLVHEDLAGLAEAVDVGVVAVSFIGEGFHGAVLEVAGAVAEHAEEDAALASAVMSVSSCSGLLMPTLKSPSVQRITRFTPARFEVRARLLIGQLETARAVGRAAGPHDLDAREDGRLFLKAGARQGHPGFSA